MKSIMLVTIVIALILIAFLLPVEKEVFIKPVSAKDSDGKSSGEIINAEDYFVILKTYPYGYMEIDEWSPAENAKEARIAVEWRTNEFGAGNIYLGYFVSDEWNETGPFNESSSAIRTVLSLPKPINYNLSKVRFRFRAEDIDFGADAIAWLRAEMIVRKQAYGLISLAG